MSASTRAAPRHRRTRVQKESREAAYLQGLSDALAPLFGLAPDRRSTVDAPEGYTIGLADGLNVTLDLAVRKRDAAIAARTVDYVDCSAAAE